MSDETNIYTPVPKNANRTELPSHSKNSVLPVWESMHEELSRNGGQWLSDLARWYEADWLVALQGGPKPAPANVLQVIAPEKREYVESALSSIDARYQSILKEIDRATVRDINEETMLHASREIENLPATLAPGERRELDETIHVTQGPTAYDQTIDLPANPLSKEFSHGAAVPKSLDFSVGQKSKGNASGSVEELPTIAGYRVERVLGRGGMGVVYLAQQLGIERPVALKMIIGGNFASSSVVERFKAEARAVGKLQHENIVRIFDSGWHGSMPYFSLEFIDGTSLSEKIAGKPLEPAEAATLAIAIGKALAYAHSVGIIHRDLKPANVLMTKEGVPKLSDFGLAKLENEQNDYSRTGDIVGTPGYMAPEQARGESTVGALADVYGLGAILYCMLSGRPPFMAAKSSDTLIQLLTKEPISIAQLQPSVPRDLETICMKCLEKTPEKRYATAADAVADLQRFVNGEPISARPVTKAERVWRWAKRKPVVAGLSAVAATLGAILMIGGPVVALVIDGQKQDIIKAKTLADDNARKAEIARDEADKNAVVAIEAKGEAEKNAQIAEKNALAAQEQQKQAVDALKSLVFEVQRELKDRPRLQTLRKGLLDVARDGLKRMEAAGTDATARNIISASVHRRLGDMQLEVGSADAAIREYEKCLAILKDLQTAGTLKGARHNLSTSYDLLAQASRKAGKFEDAEKYWTLALKERREWLTESNNNADVLQNVAVTLGHLATLAREQGNLPAARKYLEENLVSREQYVKDKPGQSDAMMQLLGTRRELALLRFAEGDADAGREEMQKVVSEFDAIANIERDSQAAQWNALLFKSDLATQLLFSRQLDESLKLYTQVAAGQQKMVDEDPQKLQFREGLAGTLYGMATAQQRKGDEAASQETFTKALAQLEVVLESDPENMPRLVTAALIKARLHRYDEARTIVEPLAATDLDAAICYVVACVYSQLSTQGESNAPDAPKTKSAIAAKETALKLLGTALAKGFDRPMDLNRDPDLDPIRNLDEFKVILTSN